MSSDNKMKGLLKGLRFISQIFDNNEKQQEIEIGHPTDVKHVAHIGCDGSSENPPGWMNEFKSVPGFSSAPLNMARDIHSHGSDDQVKWVSSDTTKRDTTRSVNHQSQEDIASKSSSRRQSNSTENMRECHAKEKSDRPRQQKKSSKHTQPPPNDSFNGSKSTEQPPMHMDTPNHSLERQGNNDLPSRNLPPDNPKRSYSKKSKDAHGVGGGSSKSRSKSQPRDPNEGQSSRSSTKSRNKHGHSEEDGQLKRGSNENVLRN